MVLPKIAVAHARPALSVNYSPFTARISTVSESETGGERIVHRLDDRTVIS
jgi:hypothetical protein